MTQTCAHCGRSIHPPKPGQYPPNVRWVHDQTPVGVENRWCRLGEPATVAEPRRP